MIKIIGISFCVLFCSALLKDKNKTFSIILSISACILAFISVSKELFDLINKVNDFAKEIPSAQSYIKLMIKTLCVILITQFASDTCRDNGESALASITETGAKVLVLIMIMPLFENVINIVVGLIK